MNISNNTVLITGGGSGIGLALAKEFQKNNNTVIITGRNLARLEKAQAANPGLEVAQCDVTDVSQIEALIETPNLIEEIPAILRSRRPDTSDEIVGVAEPNNTPPPIVIDEIVEEAGEDVEVPASPLDDPMPPLAGIGIPEPGMLSMLFILTLLNLRLRYRTS